MLIYKAKIVHVTVNCQCPVFMSCFVITFAGKLENLFGLEQADPTPDKAQAEPTPDKAQADQTPDKAQADQTPDKAQADQTPDKKG